MNYLVSDFVIRIKNAALARRKEVILPYSKLNLGIGKVLVKNGFLENIKEEEKNKKKNLKATIKFERRQPVLTEIDIISKPSLRIYGGTDAINSLARKGKRLIIISTNVGVMTGREAKKKGLGGEILFAIW
ncbi:MAG: 30S ribosomal protein S8 [Candidatus Levybacteria bacterium RBG_16_35_11]|nr:MAG: 30S ribosomal protein S8 [Candidatus Levybacteria bacterium RBG_16_35_11]